MSRPASNEHPILIAHRGWAARFPENSLAAFGAAIAAGADEIEIDVWCSKDRVPFVCHDPTVDRVSNLRGAHDSLTLDELRRAQIRMPDGSLLPGTGFPTLEETLEFCTCYVPLNIHVKDPGPDGLIIRFLREYFRARTPPCGSYIAGDAAVLDAGRRIFPEMTRCCLEGQDSGAGLLRNALKFECGRLQFGRQGYTQADVDAARDAGLITHLFWSDDATEIAELFGKGILAPLTNDIGQVRAGLRDRGLAD
ncbi:MAG: hypothetical protein A3K19_04355 [Lentisphaerae bacterium RIFOXYB12_FULL_65_16]|nr:MAG: hypothetical protein A3K18_34825 [Lentisphaerae bacterium RIFOXYA12_64_32]OGV84553.1 MAG: hypothetical protein A3K19_04355 [Lentisphaerae bacterium RIFOXYB12_FULL_65_16]